METTGRLLEVEQQVEISRPIVDVFNGLITRLSDNNVRPDGEPMTMRLEPFPGGRWFRDLGKGTGHLWGLVQVIKPPTLLEIHGPCWMSYPVSGHIQFRLVEAESGTNLTLRHRAFGLIEEEHIQGATAGWQSLLDRIAEDFSD